MTERKRRPSTLYVKLEKDRPYAVTWLTQDQKMCKLFEKEIDRINWLRSPEGISIHNNFKTKKEDFYICKSKLSPIYEFDDGRIELVIDAYTNEPNVNLKATVYKEAKHRTNVISKKYGEAKKILEESLKMFDDAHELEWNAIELRSELNRLKSNIDAALVMVEESIISSKVIIKLSKEKA